MQPRRDPRPSRGDLVALPGADLSARPHSEPARRNVQCQQNRHLRMEAEVDGDRVCFQWEILWKENATVLGFRREGGFSQACNTNEHDGHSFLERNDIVGFAEDPEVQPGRTYYYTFDIRRENPHCRSVISKLFGLNDEKYLYGESLRMIVQIPKTKLQTAVDHTKQEIEVGKIQLERMQLELRIREIQMQNATPEEMQRQLEEALRLERIRELARCRTEHEIAGERSRLESERHERLLREKMARRMTERRMGYEQMLHDRQLQAQLREDISRDLTLSADDRRMMLEDLESLFLRD